MSIHDIYEARITQATERTESYFKLVEPESLTTFDPNTVSIILPSGRMSTIIADAVEVLETKNKEIFSEIEKQDLGFALGIVFGAAMNQRGSLPAEFRSVAHLLANHPGAIHG